MTEKNYISDTWKDHFLKDNIENIHFSIKKRSFCLKRSIFIDKKAKIISLMFGSYYIVK